MTRHICKAALASIAVALRLPMTSEDNRNGYFIAQVTAENELRPFAAQISSEEWTETLKPMAGQKVGGAQVSADNERLQEYAQVSAGEEELFQPKPTEVKNLSIPA